MNPLQKNKVDIKSLSPEEQRLFRLYGKLPSRSDHFAKHLKERKYFDSGDYALSKAGKADSVDAGSVGSQHPQPENIPHRESVNGSNAATTSTGGSAVAAGIAGAPGVTPLKHAGINGVTPAAASPAKESSFLNRETKPETDGEQQEEQEGEKEEEQEAEASSTTPNAAEKVEGQSQELPIRP
ncbi:mRNA stability protein mug134 [Ceratocystis lukuohia]|uniref:mRNA stability protein n=2 Tax=Ceratocystis TaxID=5157 RepID=A0A0F8B4A4_CERFI|nr:mRNA stability protein mug134 [Ceratocystis platani]